MKKLSVLFAILVFVPGLLTRAYGTPPLDPYKAFFDGVDLNSTWKILREMSGYDPVTVNGQTFSINDRKHVNGKGQFRAYAVNAFKTLGIPVQEMPYQDGRRTGINIEAVIGGVSSESVVLISHYDSEYYPSCPNNPAVDDAASGMAIMLDVARQLVQYKGKLTHTVRLVFADAEETDFGGPDNYAAYIKSNNIKVLEAFDFDQSGWLSGSNDGNTVDIDYIDGNPKIVKSKPLADFVDQIIHKYSTLNTRRITTAGKMGLDFSGLTWNIGVPGVGVSEMDTWGNPFKDRCNDTLDKIDRNYFFKIAQVNSVIAAVLVGLE